MTFVPFGGNTIKSVQRGVITISSGTSSGTATITSVDTSKSIVNFLNWACNTGGVAQSNYSPYVTLTNTTTVTAAKGDTSAITDYVSWEVIEFN